LIAEEMKNTFKVPEWSPINGAPTDGTWSRGWDFGIEGSRRHYAIARFETGKWIKADGNQLRYLTEWQEPSFRPGSCMIDQWITFNPAPASFNEIPLRCLAAAVGRWKTRNYRPFS
jgi:hypothetical protein